MTRSVSIVIPTYNNLKLLLQCLHSTHALTYQRDSLEIIVVDNGSSDGTHESLKNAYPRVKQIRLDTNTGFAFACNHGAASASGEFVAFLNDDALPSPDWIEGLFAGLDAGGPDAVCAASHIRSGDGTQVEYEGGSANLFGVGRPRPIWGWLDAPEKAGEGSPVLFASGGAMLIQRRAFLDAGGFDAAFFAYFEDVDLGWRLWLLGHKVVYAPHAVVRHIGGATGSRSGAHRRYTLWECNSLATILKNYESDNMERILSSALMLLYKRALLSAGDTIQPAEYALTAPRDTNTANIERVPKVSIAHLAAINRFNANLPHFMAERKKMQATRCRSDAEILSMLGRPWEPQFAGEEYAAASRQIADTMRLLDLPGAEQRRVLVVAQSDDEAEAVGISSLLAHHARVALALVDEERASPPVHLAYGFLQHRLLPHDKELGDLVQSAEILVAIGNASNAQVIREAGGPLAVVDYPPGTAPNGASIFTASETDRLIEFCKRQM